MLRLTSSQNSRVKRVVKLNQRRQRDAEQRTVVEGEREVARALQAGVVPEEAFLCPDLLNPAANATSLGRLEELAASGATTLFEVSAELYDKMAYRGSSGGLLLVTPYLQHRLGSLDLPDRPLIVVVDGAEKPGNLGAVLRTADGAGVDAVLVTDEAGTGTDIHNPNAIRASLGALFTQPVVSATSDAAINWLRAAGIGIVATSPDATRPYTALDLTGAVAIVMGSEAYGLGESWLAAATERVHIPMLGRVDSLNLAGATAVVLYEAVRQRASTV